MVCLDTSFLVDLLHRDEKARELEKNRERGKRITTTPISACELFEGANSSRQVEVEVRKVGQLLRRVELLNFTIDSCELYGKVVSELRSNGRQIGEMDRLMASSALNYNEPLLTADLNHFRRIPGLKVLTW